MCVCVCVCVCVVECSQSPYVRPVEGPGWQVTQGIVGEESAAEEGTGLVVWRVCVRTLCGACVYVRCVARVCTYVVWRVCVCTLCGARVYVRCVARVCTYVVWRVCVRTRAVRTHVLVSAMVSVLCGYDY